MTKKQFWLIGAWSLIALSACSSKPKDGLTDTYTSGVIAITADESFQPIVQEEIDVFEGLFPLAGIVPRYTTEVDAINQLLKDSVRLAITTRTLTPEEMNSFHSRKFFPREIKLATDGLALIVNRQNADSLISVRDIRRILTYKSGKSSILRRGWVISNSSLITKTQARYALRLTPFVRELLCLIKT